MATTHTTDMPVAHEKPVAMTPEMQGSPHVDDRIDTPPLEGSDDGGKLEPVLTSASQSTPLNEQPVAKRAIVMLGLCLAVFLAALDVTIVTVAIVRQCPSTSNIVSLTLPAYHCRRLQSCLWLCMDW